LGAGEPKAFRPVAGAPLFVHALAACERSRAVGSIVLVVPADAVDRTRAMVRAAGLQVGDVVAGGASRQESVRWGLAALPADASVVICHDAARPFASADLFDRVVAALSVRRDVRGAVPVVPAPDTVKRVRDGMVVETLARAELALAQTPQAFDVETLRAAHARAAGLGVDATDDAMLVEAEGHVVVTVAGDPGNFKITTLEDLARAEQLLTARTGPMVK
jgi:2-C-methyl-D-erythritol 4-phosphate cytidylyltransferase